MPQRRSLIILGLAVLLGLAAVFVANSFLGRVEQRQEQAVQGTVKVAVARVPLEYGTQLSPDKVRLVDWPQASLPQGAFNSIPQLLPMGKTRVALRPIAINEPILSSKISGEGGRATISAVLRPDMRAAAVRVSDVAGVAGFVLPGDTVDVLVTRTPTDMTGGGGTQITDVLLQNVRVIAIDQDANDGKSDPKVGKTATLEVSQVDAQKLALAQQVGSLSLALRNVADQTNPVVQTVGTEDLRDGAYVGGYAGPGPSYTAPAAWSAPAGGQPARRRTAPAPKKPANTSTVLIVRGTKDSSYEVGRYAGF